MFNYKNPYVVSFNLVFIILLSIFSKDEDEDEDEYFFNNYNMNIIIFII